MSWMLFGVLKSLADNNNIQKIVDVRNYWPVGQSFALIVLMAFGLYSFHAVMIQNRELMRLKIEEIKLIQENYDEFQRNSVVREWIQMKIADKVGVDPREIEVFLEKDPIWVRFHGSISEIRPKLDLPPFVKRRGDSAPK